MKGEGKKNEGKSPSAPAPVTLRSEAGKTKQNSFSFPKGSLMKDSDRKIAQQFSDGQNQHSSAEFSPFC